MSMLSRSGPRKRKPSDQPLRRPVTHPDPNPCQCYKCGLTFLSHQQMNMHVARCKETNKQAYDSTLTYTQGELKNAVQGYSHIHNNVEMGDAYRNQLHNQPSMLDMVIDWQAYNEANDSATDVDFESNQDTFDPMFVNEDQQPSSAQSNVSDLPIKYANKMKRYEEYREK
eukprot:scaffold138987_cov46-Cyclotella_meneghiniana.AAC.1